MLAAHAAESTGSGPSDLRLESAAHVAERLLSRVNVLGKQVRKSHEGDFCRSLCECFGDGQGVTQIQHFPIRALVGVHP